MANNPFWNHIDKMLKVLTKASNSSDWTQTGITPPKLMHRTKRPAERCIFSQSNFRMASVLHSTKVKDTTIARNKFRLRVGNSEGALMGEVGGAKMQRYIITVYILAVLLFAAFARADISSPQPVTGVSYDPSRSMLHLEGSLNSACAEHPVIELLKDPMNANRAVLTVLANTTCAVSSVEAGDYDILADPRYMNWSGWTEGQKLELVIGNWQGSLPAQVVDIEVPRVFPPLSLELHSGPVVQMKQVGHSLSPDTYGIRESSGSVLALRVPEILAGKFSGYLPFKSRVRGVPLPETKVATGFRVAPFGVEDLALAIEPFAQNFAQKVMAVMEVSTIKMQ